MEVILHRALIRNCALLALLTASGVRAESGYDAWLRYAPVDDALARQYIAVMPPVISTLGNSQLELSARDELIRGIRGMLGRTLRIGSAIALERRDVSGERAIILGTSFEFGPKAESGDFVPGRYSLTTRPQAILISGDDERGVLYGAFALLRKIALGEPIDKLAEVQKLLRADPLDQPVGQPRRHHRTRLRRALHLLGQRAGSRRPEPRQRLRPTARVAWH